MMGLNIRQANTQKKTCKSLFIENGKKSSFNFNLKTSGENAFF